MLHLKLVQGELTMGNTENSAKSVHNDRDGTRQGISEQRIRLATPKLPLGHGSWETAEFYAGWMVNKEKQAVQKISGQYSGNLMLLLRPPLLLHDDPWLITPLERSLEA